MLFPFIHNKVISIGNGKILLFSGNSILFFDLKSLEITFSYSLDTKGWIRSASLSDNTLMLATSEKELISLQVNHCKNNEHEILSKLKTELSKKPVTGICTVGQDNFVTGDKFGELTLTSSGEIIGGHLSFITDIIFIPSDNLIVSCDRDECIRSTCYPKTYLIKSFYLGHEDFVSVLAALHNKRKIISGGGDKWLGVWNYDSDTTIQRLPCNGSVTGIAVESNDEELFAVIYEDACFISVYDCSSENSEITFMKNINLPTGHVPMTAYFSNRDMLLVFCKTGITFKISLISKNEDILPVEIDIKFSRSDDFTAAPQELLRVTMEDDYAPPVAGFVTKLFQMVNEKRTDSLICWSPSGSSFIISTSEEFSKTVLPRYFKHANFSSFVRQLNMYGFHKKPQFPVPDALSPNQNENPLIAATEVWEFSHSNFKRDRADLLHLIKRKVNHSSAAPTASSIGNGNHYYRQEASNSDVSNKNILPAGMDQPQMQKFIQSIPYLLEELSAIRAQQEAINSSLAAITQSNQLLWNETLAARERSSHQQDSIDKIVRFLASVFSAPTNAITNTANNKNNDSIINNGNAAALLALNGINSDRANSSASSVSSILSTPQHSAVDFPDLISQNYQNANFNSADFDVDWDAPMEDSLESPLFSPSIKHGNLNDQKHINLDKR